ncbi:hypothetical protein BCR22_03990 [Enterococcus plantarum]|uniref:V-type ATP synthase subunit G n=1 Tax=Enterococcus plantarum TaxID=1077675 RepID=A0A2W3ZB21_9ENTE|nr:hypothetical protein [Enterococcus plantarum]MBO0422247.1 hypothetical protein [Enterococcus plantarum]OEG12547.1 hypothetical protein BCR22_03990 [Enterococcus plantarum]PZL73707.1 hypothetical protein CI088_08325 [Enterococcus plantarum]
MVLEALDRIREAEDKVEKMRQVAKEELGKYEKKKSEEFQRRQEKSQAKVTALLHELETQQNEQLQKDKEILLSEAKEQNQNFRAKYEKNKEAIIDHVIERVKKVYGSQ